MMSLASPPSVPPTPHESATRWRSPSCGAGSLSSTPVRSRTLRATMTTTATLCGGLGFQWRRRSTASWAPSIGSAQSSASDCRQRGFSTSTRAASSSRAAPPSTSSSTTAPRAKRATLLPTACGSLCRRRQMASRGWTLSVGRRRCSPPTGASWRTTARPKCSCCAGARNTSSTNGCCSSCCSQASRSLSSVGAAARVIGCSPGASPGAALAACSSARPWFATNRSASCGGLGSEARRGIRCTARRAGTRSRVWEAAEYHR
mmetsp:Transcript_26823/g.66388  ORF Transcript_26823/g.66388 Transcript_26823/m.66388 type:complete len:261 (-) Transcript_26823:430-1212(-)